MISSDSQIVAKDTSLRDLSQKYSLLQKLNQHCSVYDNPPTRHVQNMSRYFTSLYGSWDARSIDTGYCSFKHV
jgi:hypothetical protein